MKNELNKSANSSSKSEKTQLAIFLGAGGVGKTTLAASFAVAAAQKGKKVALLSIDPAKRLRTALSLEHLGDELASVGLPSSFLGTLHAAQLDIEGCFRRWIREEGMPSTLENKLVEHVFFQTLVSRLATSNDAFAAVRIAEILEQESELDWIVVDTPPGLHALEFLTKPEHMREFLQSKAVDWLKWIGKSESSGSGIFSRILKKGTDKVLDGLSRIGGQGFLSAFSELLVLSEGVFENMTHRLEKACEKLHGPAARFILVASVREDALTVAEDLAGELKTLGCDTYMAALNRTLSKELQDDEGFVDFLQRARLASDDAIAFVNYIDAWVEKQIAARKRISNLCKNVVEIPLVSGLDAATDLRLMDLAELGDYMNKALLGRGRTWT